MSFGEGFELPSPDFPGSRRSPVTKEQMAAQRAQQRRIMTRQIGLDIYKYSVSAELSQHRSNINWERVNNDCRMIAKLSLAAAEAFVAVVDEEIERLQKEDQDGGGTEATPD